MCVGGGGAVGQGGGRSGERAGVYACVCMYVCVKCNCRLPAISRETQTWFWHATKQALQSPEEDI